MESSLCRYVWLGRFRLFEAESQQGEDFLRAGAQVAIDDFAQRRSKTFVQVSHRVLRIIEAAGISATVTEVTKLLSNESHQRGTIACP